MRPREDSVGMGAGAELGVGDRWRGHVRVGACSRAVASLDGVRVVAASARTPDRLTAFTAEHGGRGYANYRDLFDDPAR